MDNYLERQLVMVDFAYEEIFNNVIETVDNKPVLICRLCGAMVPAFVEDGRFNGEFFSSPQHQHVRFHQQLGF